MSNGQMNRNKEEIISHIMLNQNILKCLSYNDNTKDILKMPDITGKQKMEIKKNNIFKFKKIPMDTDTIQKTYLSMEYGQIFYMGNTGGYYSASNPYFKLPDFNFYVISHTSLDDNTIIGSRIDRIEEEIYNIFHNKITIDDFGKSFLVSSIPLILPNNYIGRQITIRFVGKNE